MSIKSTVHFQITSTMASLFNLSAKWFGNKSRPEPLPPRNKCTHLSTDSKFQLECHFTWRLIQRNSDYEQRDAKECLKHCFTHDPLDHKTNFHDFYNLTMKSFCQSVLGDNARALDYLDDVEETVVGIKDYQEAFLHIAQGNRYHILLSQRRNDEAAEYLKNIRCYHNLPMRQQVAVLAVKAVAKMTTGKMHDFHEGMREALHCATLARTESEWYFLYGKALRLHRQMIRPDSGNYTEEVAYFRKAYDLATAQYSTLKDVYGYHLGKSLLHYCWSKEYHRTRIPFLTTSQQCYSLMSNMSNNPCCSARMLARCAECFMKLPQPRLDFPRARLCLDKAYEIDKWNAIVNYTFGTYYKLKRQLVDALIHFKDAQKCPNKTLSCQIASIAIRMQLYPDTVPDIIGTICNLVDEYRDADAFTLSRIYMFRGLFMWFKFSNLSAGFEDIHIAVRQDPKIITEKLKKYCSPPLYSNDEYINLLVHLKDRFQEYFLTEKNSKDRESMKIAYLSLCNLLQQAQASKTRGIVQKSWNVSSAVERTEEPTVRPPKPLALSPSKFPPPLQRPAQGGIGFNTVKKWFGAK